MGWTYFDKGHRTAKEWFEEHLTGDLRDWTAAPAGTPWDECPLVGRRTCLKSAVKLHCGYAAVKDEWFAGTGHPKAGTSEVWAAVYLFGRAPHDPMGYTFGYKDMDESMGPRERECPKDILDLLTPLPELGGTAEERAILQDIEDNYCDIVATGDTQRKVHEWLRLRYPEEVTPFGALLRAGYIDGHAAAAAQQRSVDAFIQLNMDAVQAACAAAARRLAELVPCRYARQWRQDCRDNLAGKVPVKKGQTVRFARPIRFGNGQELQELVWSGSGGLFFGPWDARYRVRGWRKMKYEAVPQGAAAKEAA